MLKHRRSYLEIIADVVRTCPISVSRLKVETGLSHLQFQEYEDCLIQIGFLEGPCIKGNRKIYSATPKGLEFVSRLDNALGMLDGFVEVGEE